MQQSIRYKGLSLTPDEMAVENGALSLCGNLELHDGALRPSFVSGTQLAHPLAVGDEVSKLVYIHETGNYRHFVAIVSSAVYWFDKDGTLGATTPIKDFSDDSSVNSVNTISSVGNTLVITTTNGVHYALWIDEGYKYLGPKPPITDITFSLSKKDFYEDYSFGGVDCDGSASGFNAAFQQTTLGCGDALNAVNSVERKIGMSCVNIKEDKQSDVTQSVYALVNRTNSTISKNGRFYANFFIRYCYRMFDGSMIMHSAPIFMPVQVPEAYQVYPVNVYFNTFGGASLDRQVKFEDSVDVHINDKDGKEYSFKVSKLAFMYYPRNVELLYSLSTSHLDELLEWKDVIKSIDFFISAPVTKVDTSDKITSFQIEVNNYGLGRGKLSAGYKLSMSGNTISRAYTATVKFPGLSDDAYKNKMENTSTFFKVCSIGIEDLKYTDNVPLPVNKDSVYQVSLQEQMKDDYKTHNLLVPEGGYVYNHRLNLFGLKEKLFKGFGGDTLFPLSESMSSFLFSESSAKYQVQSVYVELSTTSGKKVVVSSFSTNRIEGKMLINASKFYPDARATRMIIKADEKFFAFPLTECKELNGAMFIGNFTGDEKESDYLLDSYSPQLDDTVELSNKIYTSEVDNAFYFPLNGVNTVGIGTVMGIASTTRALSQGQFGQYPLMAFSTDGIWALNVSASGTYSSIHPISREVCSNPKSITQLDQSVMFTTNRSLSRVVESQVASMSDVLDGPYFNITAKLGKLLNFFKNEDGDSAETKEIKAQMRQLIDFTESPIDFFQHCQMVYDYKNSRIFCLDVSDKTKSVSADTVALCYSIRDESWSTFLIKNVLTAINSYPHPYIQYRDGSVVALDSGYDYNGDTEYHGILISRTLKFDEENAPDAITGYIHSLTSGTVPVMWLYGSNDNQNWHYLGRCAGMKSNYMSSHSYRFFRIALYLKMKSMNQYFATRLEVIRRFGKF